MKLDTKGLVIVDRCWFSTRSHFAIKLFRFLYSSSPSLPRSSPSAVRVIGYKLTAHSSNVAHFRRRGPRTISGFDLSLNPLFHLFLCSSTPDTSYLQDRLPRSFSMPQIVRFSRFLQFSCLDRLSPSDPRNPFSRRPCNNKLQTTR